MYRNKKLRASAKGHHCTLRFPQVCENNSETVVWVHSDESKHGKGMGLKAHDIFGCYGCFPCHEFYTKNYNTDYAERFFRRAWEESLIDALDKGVIC